MIQTQAGQESPLTERSHLHVMNGGVFDENGFDIKTAEGITSDEMDVGGGNAKLEENGEGFAGDLEDGDLVEVDL